MYKDVYYLKVITNMRTDIMTTGQVYAALRHNLEDKTLTNLQVLDLMSRLEQEVQCESFDRITLAHSSTIKALTDKVANLQFVIDSIKCCLLGNDSKSLHVKSLRNEILEIMKLGV